MWLGGFDVVRKSYTHNAEISRVIYTYLTDWYVYESETKWKKIRYNYFLYPI